MRDRRSLSVEIILLSAWLSQGARPRFCLWRIDATAPRFAQGACGRHNSHFVPKPPKKNGATTSQIQPFSSYSQIFAALPCHRTNGSLKSGGDLYNRNLVVVPTHSYCKGFPSCRTDPKRASIVAIS